MASTDEVFALKKQLESSRDGCSEVFHVHLCNASISSHGSSFLNQEHHRELDDLEHSAGFCPGDICILNSCLHPPGHHAHHEPLEATSRGQYGQRYAVENKNWSDGKSSPERNQGWLSQALTHPNPYVKLLPNWLSFIHGFFCTYRTTIYR